VLEESTIDVILGMS
jgi:hypothetical protein